MNKCCVFEACVIQCLGFFFIPVTQISLLHLHLRIGVKPTNLLQTRPKATYCLALLERRRQSVGIEVKRLSLKMTN